MKRVGLCILFLWISYTTFAQEIEQDQRNVKPDSLLETYSLEDLLRYREYYKSEIDKLDEKRKELRQKGIRDAERYLECNPASRILDKVMMRLAEFYYEEANDNYLEVMQKYDQLLEKSTTDSTLIEEPKKNYDKSLALYQRIIDEFPHSDLLDDAIYNKAFLFEELGKNEEALTIYNYLINEFPSSRYVPEVLMRIAEHHFNPPINDIEKAIEIYKQILDYKESPKYDEALYRLGWCYYRLNKYPEAVAYFTLLADDIELTRKLDPSQKYSNPALRDESIEYIGISFIDYGGPEQAEKYIKSINGRDYGVEILNKIGDVYREEKEEYNKAIDAYNILLKMYPNDKMAPNFQAKIVDCYRRQSTNELVAYEAREKLYAQYKPGSPWWQKNDNEQIREKAYRFTENALRDNINLLYREAETTGNLDFYLLAVNETDKYLKSFPADTNAPILHWNMAVNLDTKLRNFERAFDEYMKICDLYWNSEYKKDAAKNAIALCKETVATDTTKKKIMVSQKQTTERYESTSLITAITHNRIELTESEKKLARAYDNYIKLFPHEPETSVILADAGALYYNNNQFAEALKYFNTIIKHFPNSKDINYARQMIMENYFGKRDFKSAEIVARKLINSPISDSPLIEKAKKRLAESIFLAAEVYKDSLNHLAAGNEYIRVVREVPDIEFADLSLFNAAIEYDKAIEFRRAVETYNYLIETKPKSKYFLNAMNNLALDYGELREYKNAAITYEKLASTAKDSLRPHDALFNASIYYVKAEEWEDAIRVNRTFVKKHPNSEDADDLFFDIATYYLKLDDLDNANKIYGEYALTYPNSPRVVETYFHRGEYYRKKNEIDQAIAEYTKAVVKNEEFKKNGIEANDFFASEALFNITRLKYDEYRQIEFYLPQSKMELDKKKKKELLKEIVDGFSRVASYGTLRLYEASYYIGDAYEDFAESWARQEIPPMEETKRIVIQKEINQAAADLYERAEKSYKQAVKVLAKLASNYEQELLNADTVNVIDKTRLKIVAEDSTLRVAQKWIERCKDKISEVIYDNAELNFASVNSLINAPIPQGLDDVAEMEYRRQVLNKVVAPLIKQITETHVRNIIESQLVGLENQWVKSSRSKIVSTNNILSDEYHKLALIALQLYTNNSQKFIKAIEKGEVINEELGIVTISDQMANLIDFGRVFTTLVLDLQKNTIHEAATYNISDPIIAVTKEQMMQYLYEYIQKCDSIIAITNSNRKKFENLYKETNKPEYEEASFNYEDNFFSLRESVKELLEKGVQISEEMGINNKWAAEILLLLVRTDPEKYSNLLGLSIETKKIFTDESWLATDTYYSGWINVDYDDSHWYPANIIVGNMHDPDALPLTIWYIKTDTLAIIADTTIAYHKSESESTTTVDSVRDYQILISHKPQIEKVLSKKVFFRKEFVVEGLPVSAELKLKVDDSYNLFLNGEYIAVFAADSTEWRYERSHQLGDFIVTNKNVLTIDGRDGNNTAGGLQATLIIKSIPDWDIKRQKYLIETSDEKIKQNLVMDKYIIIF